MAVSLQRMTVDRVTLSGTANNAIEINLGGAVRRLEVRFFDAAGTSYAAGKLALTGTDGAAIGTDFLTVGEGELYEVRFAPGRRVPVYLASAISSAIVEIAAWEE